MSLPLWFTFSNSRILISCVSKGFNCFVAAVEARVRCGVPKLELAGGLWNVADGEVETVMLWETVLSSLLEEGAMSLAGVAIFAQVVAWILSRMLL